MAQGSKSESNALGNGCLGETRGGRFRLRPDGGAVRFPTKGNLSMGRGILCQNCSGQMDRVASTRRVPDGVIRYRKCACGQLLTTIEIPKQRLQELQAAVRATGVDPQLIADVVAVQTPLPKHTVTRKTNLYDFVSAIASHSTRARLYGVVDSLTLEDWGEILSQTDWKCAMCGSDREIEIEHMIPLSRGGGNTKDNVCVLCADCNGRKGAKMPLEWVFSR